MNKRARKQQVLIVVASLMVSFLALELFLRLPEPLALPRKYLWPIIYNSETYECRTTDPILHHRLKSNCSGRIKSGDDFITSITTNAYGLRSPEVSLDKPEGVFRILVLGDSFTEGWGVEEDELFSRVVERELNRYCHSERSEESSFKEILRCTSFTQDDKAGIGSLSPFAENRDRELEGALLALPKIEVINAGTGSYSPILELTYVVHAGVVFDPDLVIVMVDSNDAKDDYFYGGWDRLRELNEAYIHEDFDEVRVWPRQGTVSRLLEPSKAASFMYTVVKSNIDSRNQELTYESIRSNNTLNVRAAGWEGYEDMFELTGENLRLMKQFLDERGISLVASISARGLYQSTDSWCPGREQWGYECGVLYDPAPVRELEKQIREANITYIDTYEALVRSGDDDLYYPNDGHWTAKAHEIVGETIVEELLQSN